MDKSKRLFIVFFSIAIVFIAMDQVSKLWAVEYFEGQITLNGTFKPVSIISDILQITYTKNPGMAFSIEFGVWKIFLSLFSLIASVCLTIYLYKIRKHSKWVQFGILMILAGAMGNCIDRILYGVIFGDAPLFYGLVVDFILVKVPEWTGMTHWPVFNFADSYVTIGVAVLLIAYKSIPAYREVFPHKTQIPADEQR